MIDQVPATPERRKPDTVVTSENLAEYQNKKLDIADMTMPVKEEPKVEENKEEITVASDLKERKAEEKKEEEKIELDKVDKKVLKKTNHNIEERFSELTKQRKEALARAEVAEKRAVELEEQLKPKDLPKEPEKPDKTKYTDAFEYAEDLSVWSAHKALRDKDESDRKIAFEREQQQKITTWNTRLNQTKKEIPDFEEKISGSTVQVSNEVRDAIIDSDIGPKILLHLADNPEEAEKLGKMTVQKALISLGKLEARLSEPPKAEPKKEPKEPEVEISKAPAPISPLRGASNPVNSAVEFTENNATVYSSAPGAHEKYKAARRSGQIK